MNYRKLKRQIQEQNTPHVEAVRAVQLLRQQQIRIIRGVLRAKLATIARNWGAMPALCQAGDIGYAALYVMQELAFALGQAMERQADREMEQLMEAYRGDVEQPHLLVPDKRLVVPDRELEVHEQERGLILPGQPDPNAERPQIVVATS